MALNLAKFKFNSVLKLNKNKVDVVYQSHRQHLFKYRHPLKNIQSYRRINNISYRLYHNYMFRMDKNSNENEVIS